jgi:16S rRNA (uracil1498-N3)-methyltransferase
MQLFYNPNISETTTTFALIKKKANILLKYFVKDTDILHVTNGLGFI